MTSLEGDGTAGAAAGLSRRVTHVVQTRVGPGVWVDFRNRTDPGDAALLLEQIRHNHLGEVFRLVRRTVTDEPSGPAGDRDEHLRLAVKVAMVRLVTGIGSRDEHDRAVACEANGWARSDLSDLYATAVGTVLELTGGSLDPTVYIRSEDR